GPPAAPPPPADGPMASAAQATLQIGGPADAEPLVGPARAEMEAEAEEEETTGPPADARASRLAVAAGSRPCASSPRRPAPPRAGARAPETCEPSRGLEGL
ncbi:unnamed protein product, partial [Prorocentrum cordatum]